MSPTMTAPWRREQWSSLRPDVGDREVETIARIIGIAGSLRRGSCNGALLRAAKELAPGGVEVEIASIAEIPLYDGDLESERGIPDPVTTLKDRIAAASGLLLVTPEYNSSIPGVLKNAIDWLSRPPKDIPWVFGGKPVAIIGATPGAGGTRLAQSAWLPVLRTLGARAWAGKQLYVAGAGTVFDPEGKLVDEKIRKLLSEFVAGFAAFVKVP
jgi:NAD(P)H-dependent FMN reductase